jgi:hypothetical protein
VHSHSQTCIYFYQNEMDLMLVEVLVGVQEKKKKKKSSLKVAGPAEASRWPFLASGQLLMTSLLRH